MIGEQIKKFRLKKGYTQEELGKIVGVTTQAVSKWERGGSPDAELLPRLANALGITISMLFDNGSTDTFDDAISDELLSMDREEGLKRLFSLMWRLSLGLSGMDSAKRGFADNGYALEELKEKNGYHYYARSSTDEGMFNAKMDSDFRYLFFMPEPENGYAEFFDNISSFTELFSVIADNDVWKILFYMYSRINLPISLQLIASNTKLDIEKTESLMDKLCKFNLACCTPVATENGSMKTYTYLNETVIIPLLCLAKEVRDKNIIHWGIWFDRNKPLF